MKKVVYVMCTNVGRAILKAHLSFHKKIDISKIYNLNTQKGSIKSNYDSYSDLKYNDNLPVEYIDNINDQKVISEIKKIKPDLIIQSGWSQKFNNKLLNIPKYGCVGEHASPIPVGRGAATVNWAIIEGKKNWGDTFFLMNEEFDRGPMINQDAFRISSYDTVKSVYDKVAISSYFTIKNKLNLWVNGKYKFLKVDESKATYYKKRTPKDGEVNFRKNANFNQKLIQAVTKPFPGAFFNFKKNKIIVWNSKKVKSNKIQIKSIKHISKNIFIFKNELYMKFSCGNFIKPISMESSKTPLADNKKFVISFINFLK
tara:strand:- start:199 stop:1140 length:942 start_codon:yes stop_codon:yes gene_type:complete